MNLTDYAVYKEDNKPWKLDEVNLIAKLMGDHNTSFISINNPTKRFVYSWDDDVHNWSEQNIEGKTEITFKEFLKLAKPQEIDPFRSHLERIQTNLLELLKLKQEKQMTKGKYLSLKINNGEANVRELIYQAYNTNIKDPRPYVQTLITNEKDRLKSIVLSLDLDTIQYGYNIKLATLVNETKNFQQHLRDNPSMELDNLTCTYIYTLLDEIAILSAMQAHAEDNKLEYKDPYIWIAKYLTDSVLNSPKPTTLFVSNKLHIYIKDGYVHYNEHKTGRTYKAAIKLDIKSNTYYI